LERGQETRSAGVAFWRLSALKWSNRKLIGLAEIKYTKLILCYSKSVTSLILPTCPCKQIATPLLSTEPSKFHAITGHAGTED